MKKAKAAAETGEKPADIFSILSKFKNGLTGGAKNETPEEKKEPEPAPSKQGAPPPPTPPFFTKSNAYNSVIEKHDKIVKRILKQNKINK